MSGLRLAVFDFDGTLIDSQRAIIHAMETAFRKEDLAPPQPEAIRRIVGLSVPEAVAALAPGAAPDRLFRLDQGFRAASIAYREERGGDDAPLFPGARAALERIEAQGVLLGVATGKARRGLDHAFEVYGLGRFFTATQTADDAPSKPHPGMLENCERLTGVDRENMVMIGDTTFDILMAGAHGCASVGVSWGYHDPAELKAAGAECVVESFDALHGALDEIWGR